MMDDEKFKELMDKLRQSREEVQQLWQEFEKKFADLQTEVTSAVVLPPAGPHTLRATDANIGSGTLD